jgi:hypothetical protein
LWAVTVSRKIKIKASKPATPIQCLVWQVADWLKISDLKYTNLNLKPLPMLSETGLDAEAQWFLSLEKELE